MNRPDDEPAGYKLLMKQGQVQAPGKAGAVRRGTAALSRCGATSIRLAAGWPVSRIPTETEETERCISMDFAAARHNMIESQLRPNRVTDERVLAAFAETPREVFVPDAMRSVAYVDEDIEVAPGRWMMEPMVLGRLVAAARPQSSDVALVVGCATGYSAAVLARLVNTVVAVESASDLAARATRNFTELSIDNVVLLEGPLEAGDPRQAPYDVILIDGAVGEIPQKMQDQLAEGGRLVTVLRSGPVGRAMLLTRIGGAVSRRILFDAAVPLLPGFVRAPGFVF